MRERSIAGISLICVVLGGIAASVSAQSKAPGSPIDDIRHELLQLPYYGVFDFLSFKYDKGTVDLIFDATTTNPEWMGEEPERLQRLMPA